MHLLLLPSFLHYGNPAHWQCCLFSSQLSVLSSPSPPPPTRRADEETKERAQKAKAELVGKQQASLANAAVAATLGGKSKGKVNKWDKWSSAAAAGPAAGAAGGEAGGAAGGKGKKGAAGKKAGGKKGAAAADSEGGSEGGAAGASSDVSGAAAAAADSKAKVGAACSAMVLAAAGWGGGRFLEPDRMTGLQPHCTAGPTLKHHTRNSPRTLHCQAAGGLPRMGLTGAATVGSDDASTIHVKCAQPCCT